jgi:hypothetical protein
MRHLAVQCTVIEEENPGFVIHGAEAVVQGHILSYQ